MYSHEELISAVSAAGRDGKTFTVKDVRTQLGFDSRDKKELSRFRRRLRAFEKAAADQLEKLGNNSYRLRAGAFEEAADPATGTVAKPAITATRVAVTADVEVATSAPDDAKQEAETTTPEVAAAPEQPMAAHETAEATIDVAARVAVTAQPVGAAHEPEVQLEPASGVFQSAVPANEPEGQQPVREAPALHVVAPAYSGATQPAPSTQAAYEAAPALPPEHNVSTPQRVLSVAGALVSSALAASAAVSGRVRERGRNLREQLWSCVRSGSTRKHAFARVRGWAESVRPLSNEVREQLSALRQRVLAGRRRAA